MKRTKIYVSGKYNRDTVTNILAENIDGRLYCTRKQYHAAEKRLGLASGDGLRLAAVGDNDAPHGVLVRDGQRDWAIID